MPGTIHRQFLTLEYVDYLATIRAAMARLGHQDLDKVRRWPISRLLEEWRYLQKVIKMEHPDK